MKEYYRVQAEIDLDAIRHNLIETRKHLNDDTLLMAIVKADGYGHGAVPIAWAVDDIADAYGVAIIEEAIELRNAGITKPILVLGYTSEEAFDQVIEYDLTQTVFKYEMAKALSEKAMSLNKTANIHIKLDTGMSRIGFKDTEESVAIIDDISKLKGICITGMFTHFACADMAEKTSAHGQYDRYLTFVSKLKEAGIRIPIKHVANSAAIIDLPDTYMNMVRSGISTYGLYPSEEVMKNRLNLRPALELKSTVVYVKEVEPGTGVGYGSTFVAARRTKVATIPVGYADGYPRALSGRARVLIHGQSAPIIGRICMDQFMVDVTEIDNVIEGDTVTLVGKDGEERITVEELADMAYSFNYEFVCDISKRVPRVYYREGKKIGTVCYHSEYDFTNEVCKASFDANM